MVSSSKKVIKNPYKIRKMIKTKIKKIQKLEKTKMSKIEFF